MEPLEAMKPHNIEWVKRENMTTVNWVNLSTINLRQISVRNDLLSKWYQWRAEKIQTGSIYSPGSAIFEFKA